MAKDTCKSHLAVLPKATRAGGRACLAATGQSPAPLQVALPPQGPSTDTRHDDVTVTSLPMKPAIFSKRLIPAFAQQIFIESLLCANRCG